MRVLKTLYLVALFSLSLGLFCGELPETMSLRDDTSNDYVNDSSATAAQQEKAVDQKEIVSEQNAASEQCKVITTTPTPSAGPTVLSGQELLQKYSIRRT